MNYQVNQRCGGGLISSAVLATHSLTVALLSAILTGTHLVVMVGLVAVPRPLVLVWGALTIEKLGLGGRQVILLF